MRDPKKYTIAQACHWLNRCYDLGFTAEEVVARSVSKRNASKRLDTKEKRRMLARTMALYFFAKSGMENCQKFKEEMQLYPERVFNLVVGKSG